MSEPIYYTAVPSSLLERNVFRFGHMWAWYARLTIHDEEGGEPRIIKRHGSALTKKRALRKADRAWNALKTEQDKEGT